MAGFVQLIPDYRYLSDVFVTSEGKFMLQGTAA